jgi:hypothetical protein
MMYHLKRAIKVVLGRDIAGRQFPVYPDDIFIASYPRSGNTWTRFLIANLLFPNKQVSFSNIETLIPDCEALSTRALRGFPRPRIIKTHRYYDPRCRKVLYIVRDPRDVAVSYYDFSRKYRQIADQYPLANYVDDFVQGRLLSADWGTWRENAGSWIGARGGSEGFLLLRYEDLKCETGRELARVAEFFGIAVTPDRLSRAIQLSSADRMREMEKSGSGQWIGNQRARNDIPFVRTATSGGWKANLPRECVARIEAAWGAQMAGLGYELTTTAVQAAPSRSFCSAPPS